MKRYKEKGVINARFTHTGNKWTYAPFYYTEVIWWGEHKLLCGSFTQGQMNRMLEVSTGCWAVMSEKNVDADKLYHMFQLKLHECKDTFAEVVSTAYSRFNLLDSFYQPWQQNILINLL